MRQSDLHYPKLALVHVKGDKEDTFGAPEMSVIG